MPLEVQPPNPAQKLMQRIAMTAVGARLISTFAHHLDRGVLALTRGRYSMVGWVVGLPLITVTMRGAKSGQPRAVPLLGIPMQHEIVIIGSNWGRAQHPAWIYNLRAHPSVTVTVNNARQAFVAREVEGAEREVCWQAANKIYPGYDLYKQRAPHRKISVWRLTPQA